MNGMPELMDNQLVDPVLRIIVLRPDGQELYPPGSIRGKGIGMDSLGMKDDGKPLWIGLQRIAFWKIDMLKAVGNILSMLTERFRENDSEVFCSDFLPFDGRRIGAKVEIL